MTDEEFLRAIPKVELHCHLEGAVPAATFVELAREKRIPLPTYDAELVYELGDSLESFLEMYGKVSASMTTADDFSRVAYETLREAATKGNLRYREMFFNPTNHPDLSYRDALDGLRDGIRAAEVDHGVVCRLIPAINREQPPATALALVEEVIANPCDEVIGVGLDHNELAGPPAAFVEAFARAREAGLHRTAHAGERNSSEEIAASLDLLGCERIDHGYAVLGDRALVARMRDDGVHVTTCWTISVWHHGDDRGTTPIGRMAEAGLWISINSDDPPMAGTDIGEEYVRAAATLGLSRERMVEFVFAALDAAWLPEDERRRMRDELEREIAQLRAR
jgi:adenosine deaminase